MFFSFSFPLGKEVNTADFRTRIKRINHFFKQKADLSGKSRAFGVQLLVPSSIVVPEDSDDYYLCFKFFNEHKEPQKKLQLLYGIGTSRKLYSKLQLDVCCLSRISGLELQWVEFSYDKANLNISVEFSDEYDSTMQSYLDMLFQNFKN